MGISWCGIDKQENISILGDLLWLIYELFLAREARLLEQHYNLQPKRNKKSLSLMPSVQSSNAQLCVTCGLYWVGQKFLWVFPQHLTEKSDRMFWPTRQKVQQISLSPVPTFIAGTLAENSISVSYLSSHWYSSVQHVICISILLLLFSPKSCLPFCYPMACNLPGSSAHGISQARVLECLPFPSPGDLPDPGIEPESPALAGRFFTTEPSGKPTFSLYYFLNNSHCGCLQPC